MQNFMQQWISKFALAAFARVTLNNVTDEAWLGNKSTIIYRLIAQIMCNNDVIP